MKTIFKLITIIYVMSFMNCSKDSISEEPFSGTMQAKINGELVVFDTAYGNSFFDLERSCYEKFHKLFGSMENKEGVGHSINLGFSPSQGVGEYSLNAQYTIWTGPYYDRNNSVGYGFNHLCNEGMVTITSTSNNRYKGVFNFVVKDNECNDTIIVTDGEFEIGQEILYDRPCL